MGKDLYIAKIERIKEEGLLTLFKAVEKKLQKDETYPLKEKKRNIKPIVMKNNSANNDFYEAHTVYNNLTEIEKIKFEALKREILLDNTGKVSSEDDLMASITALEKMGKIKTIGEEVKNWSY